MNATCEDCRQEMTPGGGCSFTHVSKTEKGKSVARIVCGGDGDWGAECSGGVCGDCNAAPGKPHHPGCDIERCPTCGNQMLGCLGGVEGCGWAYLSQREVVGVPGGR